MSLDHIEFPAIVLQNLYAKSMFDLKTGRSDITVSKVNTTASLGNNKKRIVIIVMYPEAIYLPDDELPFLLGILSACKLSMEDIALVNRSTDSTLLYKDLAEQFKAEKIFLFGVVPEVLGLPLQFPLYQIQPFNNQLYLSSASLTDLQNDKAEKTKLWNCLKKIFSI